MLKLTSLVIIIVFMIPQIAVGEGRSLNVAAFRIQQVLEPDKSGLYDQILEQVTRQTGIEFDVKILPIARARAAYDKGVFDCLIPLDPLFEGRHEDHLSSVPFYEAHLFGITRVGDELIQDVESLKSRKVGGEIGIPYTEEIDQIIGMQKTSSLLSAVKMLEAGRFDAIVAYTPDIKELLEHEDITSVHYDPEKPIAIYNDALTCRPTDENLELLNMINHALVDILQE